MDISKFKKSEGDAFYTTLDDFRDLEFAKVDVDLFAFQSRKAYEAFIVPNKKYTEYRASHITYAATIAIPPKTPYFPQILFTHCVKNEVDKCAFMDPVLIIRLSPEIDDNNLFRCRFSLAERSWLQYLILPFDIESHKDGRW